MPDISRSSVVLPAPLADERHPVALAQVQVDVAQRLDDRHLGLGADEPACAAEDGLLQRAGLRVEDREVDRGVLDVDPDHVLPQTQYATRER
jgi:hypothetical protein